MSEFKAPYVAIGMNVQWFRHGRTTEKPIPAIVIEVMDQATGVIEIRTVGKTGAGQWLGSVRHVNDPFFKTATAQYRESRGAWRLIPPQPIEQSVSQGSKERGK